MKTESIIKAFENINLFNSCTNMYKDYQVHFRLLFEVISMLYGKAASALFVYPGSKKRMHRELNIIFEHLYLEKRHQTGTGYKTFVDVFGGAANSTLVLMKNLQLTNFERIIINDIDSCIVQTHKDVKDNGTEIINEFCEIIRTKFIIPYGSIILTKLQYDLIKSELTEEFLNLQDKQEFGIQTSTRFIFLRDLEFSGIVKYNKDGGYKFDKKVFANNTMFNIIMNYIPKIKEFNYIYNKLDIEFTNKDCFELLNQDDIKNNSDCLINLDPPYLATDSDNTDNTSNEIKNCTINYNQDFKHIDLLDMLPDMNFIYNNNKHTKIKEYADKLNCNMDKFFRPNNIGVKKGQKAKKQIEYILYKNSLL